MCIPRSYQPPYRADKSGSFFVGDAAGRQYPGGRQDFASTDRKWAINIGVPFFTPEVHYLTASNARSNF